MNRTLRRSSLAVLAALVGVVATAAIAWACTPQAYLYLGATSVTPPSGGGGAPVTVTGRGFTSGPVQIRLDGRRLATAQGPNFSVVVRIENAAPGAHYVQGAAYNADGSLAGGASRALMVKAAAPARQAVPISPPRVAPSRPSRPSTRAATPRPAHRAARPTSRPAHRRVRPADRGSARPAAAPAPAVQPPVAIAPAPPGAAKPKERVSRPAATRPPGPVALPARNPWIVRAPVGLTVTDRAGADDGASGLVIALAAGLLALGLAGIGGAGVALARTRTRSPAPTLAADALPVPVAEPHTSSLDAELQVLLAEHYAREERGSAGREEVAPREGVDSPH